MLVNFALFGRFFLEFAMMYPAEYLCLASLQEHLRAPRKTYAIGTSVITLMSLAGAAVCSMLDIETNFLLIPLLIISFWLLRWRTDREVSISQTMFLFSVSAVMMSVCTLLAVVLNAEAELDNALPVFLPSTSVICLTLSVILSTIFRFTAVRWSRWLLQEYHGEAFWESAWPLPALYAAFLVFCMPKEIGIVLMNRIRIIAVLAVSISLLGIFLLLYEMYHVAKEYTRSSQLDRENQLLAVESRRYMELRSYLEQTRHLRHDFRQHLHVISGPPCVPTLRWMRLPATTTMRPGDRAFRWNGNWNCPDSCPCRKPICAPFLAICWKMRSMPARSCRRKNGRSRCWPGCSVRP